MEVVAGLGGPDEMERLLALGEQELQEECDSIPLHLRKAGLVQGSSLHLRQPSRYTSVDVDPATPGRRSLAVSSGSARWFGEFKGGLRHFHDSDHFFLKEAVRDTQAV